MFQQQCILLFSHFFQFCSGGVAKKSNSTPRNIFELPFFGDSEDFWTELKDITVYHFLIFLVNFFFSTWPVQYDFLNFFFLFINSLNLLQSCQVYYEEFFSFDSKFLFSPSYRFLSQILSFYFIFTLNF